MQRAFFSLSFAVMHYEYFPQGHTGTDSLQNLQENVQQKWPWKCIWILVSPPWQWTYTQCFVFT